MIPGSTSDLFSYREMIFSCENENSSCQDVEPVDSLLPSSRSQEPMSMIKASYKMFLQWGWVKSDNLNVDVKKQLNNFRRCTRRKRHTILPIKALPFGSCNVTLYDNPYLVATLPPDDLLQYFGQCWKGAWSHFVTNSFTSVCFASWIAAGFERSQFMGIRSTSLRTMRAHDLLQQVRSDSRA